MGGGGYGWWWLWVVVMIVLCSEKVHEVPNLLVKYRESKHYLQATEVLVNSGR